MPNVLKFAIPVDWNQASAYENNTIVFVGKKAYTSIQAVPANIAITNTDYWSETGVPYIDISTVNTRLNELESDVATNTSDITQAQSDIVTNANNLTTLTTRLNTAVTALENDIARVDNIMITLYTPNMTA